MRMVRIMLGLWIGGFLLAAVFPFAVLAGESANTESRQITLSKSIGERQYKGTTVEGEERRVAPGDSLWRILIQGKGLSRKRFGQYMVVIHGLNPKLAPSGALRIGEFVFIPLRLDEVVDTQKESPSKRTAVAPARVAKGATEEYRVKTGDHLYQILRDRLGVVNEQQLAVYYALVKDLNPQKTNWDLLVEGETIRLPVLGNPAEARALANRQTAENKPGSSPVTTAAPAKNAGPSTVGEASVRRSTEAKSAAQIGESENPKSSPAQVQAAAPTPVESSAPTEPAIVPHAEFKSPEQIPARTNLALVAQVVEALGNEVQRDGEEHLPVKEGVVTLQKSSFPLVFNRSLDEKVILDPENKVPSAVRSDLGQRENTTTVFSLSRNMSVKQAVTELLARLGYQSLAADRPMVIQEGGLAFEAKGDWILLAPQVSHRKQDVFIVNIADGNAAIPDYLQSQLALSGVHFRNISLPDSVAAANAASTPDSKVLLAQSKVWPRDKKEIVDALLFAYGIPVGASEVLPVELEQGMKFEATCDRVFELHGQRIAVFFHPVGPELRQALQEKLGVKTVELDLDALSSRELIGKLLTAIGEPATYEEHRFNAATGSKPDELVVSAWGFLLAHRPLFLTDRKIPKGYERFFFEKGLDIVYFQ